jgi:hypothetical protein
MWAPSFDATRRSQTFLMFGTTCYWRRSIWIIRVLRLPQRCSTPMLRPRRLSHRSPRRLASPVAATVATGIKTIRTTTTAIAAATMARTTTVVAAVVALLARPPPPLPLMAEPAHRGRRPVTETHDRLLRSCARWTASSVGLHGHIRPLPVTWIPTRPPAAVAAAVPVGRARSLTRLEPLGRCELGLAVAGPLLQHQGAPPTSDIGPGLGGRFRSDAPHQSVS